MTFSSDACQEALRVLRAEYANRVRDFAIDILSRTARKEISGREAFDEALWQDIDGADVVVYTFKAKLCLLCSDNEDAMQDEFGERGTPEQMAFHAILADVRAELDALLPMEEDANVVGLDAAEIKALAAGPFEPDDDSTYPENMQTEEDEK